jgi:hypothetical protein
MSLLWEKDTNDSPQQCDYSSRPNRNFGACSREIAMNEHEIFKYREFIGVEYGVLRCRNKYFKTDKCNECADKFGCYSLPSSEAIDTTKSIRAPQVGEILHDYYNNLCVIVSKPKLGETFTWQTKLRVYCDAFVVADGNLVSTTWFVTSNFKAKLGTDAFIRDSVNKALKLQESYNKLVEKAKEWTH